MGKIVEIKDYRYTIRKGDIVRMPWGVEGKVVFVDVVFRGGKYCKIVFVEPETNWLFRWIMWFCGRLWYCDNDINKLNLLRKGKKK